MLISWSESCKLTKFNLGIQGEYKLVKVNGTVQNLEGYFLRLGNPQGDWWNKIWTQLYFGDHDVLRGDIVEDGKDAEGDLCMFVNQIHGIEERARVRGKFQSPQRT